MKNNNGTAVVTGASSGIGAIYADRLAKRGYNLLLVARDEERMNKLATKLVGTYGIEVEVLRADLTKHEDVLKLEERLQKDEAISMLVNNAGMASAGPIVSANADTLENLINLNITALTRLTVAVVPSFVARKAGTIVNIASVVALNPELIGAAYSGSKAYVLNFTQALQTELKDSGVRVQAVLPGATSTELWDRSGFPLSHLPSEIVMSAEDMVDAALVGLDKNELVTIPSLPEEKDWQNFLGARQALAPNLSRSQPATRYKN